MVCALLITAAGATRLVCTRDGPHSASPGGGAAGRRAGAFCLRCLRLAAHAVLAGLHDVRRLPAGPAPVAALRRARRAGGWRGGGGAAGPTAAGRHLQRQRRPGPCRCSPRPASAWPAPSASPCRCLWSPWPRRTCPAWRRSAPRALSVPVSPVITTTGPGHAGAGAVRRLCLNLAAITAAICMGREAHEDPAQRWKAAAAAGVIYIIVGLLGGAVVGLIAAFPERAGAGRGRFCLLGTIGGGLAVAMKDDAQREAALITFLVTASGLTLWGVGAAFWGVVAGALALAVQRWRQKPPVSAPFREQLCQSRCLGPAWPTFGAACFRYTLGEPLSAAGATHAMSTSVFSVRSRAAPGRPGPAVRRRTGPGRALERAREPWRPRRTVAPRHLHGHQRGGERGAARGACRRSQHRDVHRRHGRPLRHARAAERHLRRPGPRGGQRACATVMCLWPAACRVCRR